MHFQDNFILPPIYSSASNVGAGTFAFFLQTLQLLLSEQDLSIVGSWQGLTTLLQWVEWLASYFILQYEPQPEMGAPPLPDYKFNQARTRLVEGQMGSRYHQIPTAPVARAAGGARIE